MKNVCCGHPHVSLAKGVCYCPDTHTLYVRLLDVFHGLQGLVPEFVLRPWAKTTFLDAFREAWPNVPVTGCTVLEREEWVKGLDYDGDDACELDQRQEGR